MADAFAQAQQTQQIVNNDTNTTRVVTGWNAWNTYATVQATATAVQTQSSNRAAVTFKKAVAQANVVYAAAVGTSKQALSVAQANAVANRAIAIALATANQNLADAQAQLASDEGENLFYFSGLTPPAQQTVGSQLTRALSQDLASGAAFTGGYFNTLTTLGDITTNGAWSRFWSSPEVGRVIDAVDGFFAGMAHALTAGLTTRLRTAMYGDLATRNHQGFWFNVGVGVGTALSMVLGFANPCGLSAIGQIGLRALNGLQAVGGIINAVENIANGNYLTAGLDLLGVTGNMFQMFRACFTGETKLMARGTWGTGLRRIDQITTNDEVLSRDEGDVNGPLEWKKVEELFARFARITNLHVRGQVIRTTAEHPFYAYNKGWVPAGELRVGDWLASHDGQWVQLEDLCDASDFEVVYNMRVADFHTYFVGDETWGFSIWAHNAYIAPYGSMPSRYGYQAHHIGQNAALTRLAGYIRGRAPAILLRGGSYLVGSAHYLANLAQNSINAALRATGATSQSVLQLVRTARQALQAAGVSRADRREAIRALLEYLRSLGVNGSTRFPIPG